MKEEPRKKRTRVNVSEWELSGLMLKAMDEIQDVFQASDSSGKKIIFMFKDKPKDSETYPISNTLHNRFLALFRKFYKTIVLLEFDNVIDEQKRKELMIKNREKKELKEMEEMKMRIQKRREKCQA